MTASAPVHIFVDANTALHFKRPDHVDWHALTGADGVILVAAPIFLRELERQKVHNPSRKLRDRANAYVKWLAEFVRDPSREARRGTKWLFLPFEPQIDFESHHLSPTISDDHLIASVIAFAQRTSDPILVATADIGLEMKLQARKIAALLMPDDLLLPDEPDPQEKELLNLRRQLAQQRAPVLTLLTGADGNQYPFELLPEVKVPSAPSLQEMRRKHPLLTDDRATPPADDNSLARVVRASSFQSLWLTPERIQTYNSKLEEFFTEYQTFLKNLLMWEQEAALTVEVGLSLFNQGTAPGSDIDVTLTFPDDIVVVTGDSVTEKPDPPEPPQRPAPFPEHPWTSVDIDRLIRSRYEGFPMPEIEGPKSVTIEGNQVNFWLRNLKHGSTEQLDSVFIRFANRQAIRSFAAEYKISAAELPNTIVDRLHFILT